jgi:circadian clock protein KaiB
MTPHWDLPTGKKMKKSVLYKLLLYVAGDAPNSSEALTNLHALCQKHLPGQYEIEVVDVLKQPHQALTHGVFITPQLVKTQPGPTRKVIGRLDQWDRVLTALGLPVGGAASKGNRLRGFPKK